MNFLKAKRWLLLLNTLLLPSVKLYPLSLANMTRMITTTNSAYMIKTVTKIPTVLAVEGIFEL